jgi:hypothetical protein
VTTLRIDGPIGVTTAELAAGLDSVAAASRDYATFLRGALESLCDSMGMPRSCVDEVVRDNEG